MESMDVSRAIVAKSDQLNADDLVSGPITVQITSASVKPSGEQPVTLGISGGHQPWRPCKTMLRVLTVGWGKYAEQWVGRSVTLYRDPTVKWSGEAVGGIRVSAMSHIQKRIEVSLAVTKGKKGKHVIEILPDEHMSLDELKRACAAAQRNGWTREQIAAALGGRVADVSAEARRECAAVLSRVPESLQPATSAELSEDDKAAIIAAERAEAGA